MGTSKLTARRRGSFDLAQSKVAHLGEFSADRLLFLPIPPLEQMPVQGDEIGNQASGEPGGLPL